MEEIGPFRAIPFYPGYEIDVFGNVRRISKGGRIKMMTPLLRRGSLTIRLTVPGGARKEQFISKLVVLTFLGPPPPGTRIYHKNGDKLDNCVNNLGFTDAVSLGKRTGFRSKARAVLKIDREGEVIEVHRSARAAAKAGYMSYQTVIDRCNGKTKSTYAPDGYKYEWDS
jgi:hypothetical protein